MKLLGRVLALILTMLSAVLITVTFLLVSPQGLEWTYRIAKALLPGELKIEKLDGQLRGPLQLSGLHYHNAQVDIDLAQLKLQWQPGELVKARLHIETLSITGLHILQTSSAGTAGASKLPDVNLPLSIQIDDASLHDMSLTEPGNNGGFVLNDVKLRNAAFHRGRLDLEHLTLNTPQFYLSVSGRLTPQRDYPLDLTVEWSADGGDYGTLTGSGRLHGDLRKIDVQHRLTSPLRIDLRGAITDPLGKLGWQGEMNWPAFNLHALNAAWPVLSVAGKVHGSGDLKRVQAEGELHSLFQNLHANHRFVIDYDHDQATIKVRRFISTLLESGTTLAIHGTLSELAQTPSAELAGSWQNLRWPLQGEPATQSKAGTFSLSGDLNNYQLKVGGDVAGEQIPSSTWLIDASGQAQSLTVTRAAAQLLGGTLSAKGHLDWQAALRWRMNIEGQDLDPGKQWPEWPSRLAFSAQVEGDLNDDKLRTQVALTHLQGKLKSIPLDADASLSINDDQFKLGKLRIDSGGNRLTAAGTLRNEWDLEWQISAANLGGLVPGSGGSLRGSGRVSGARLHPSFTASLAGKEARFADNRIGALSLVMAWDSLGRIPSTVEIEVNDADFGERHFDSIRLRGDGKAQHHQARLWVTSPAVKLQLALSGEYGQRTWQGSMDHLDLEAPAIGQWHLDTPAPISFGKNSVRLHEFCLQQDQARLCAEANRNAADDWQLRSSAHDLPVSIFEQWLPTGSSLSGKLDAQGQIDATPTAPIAGSLEITLQAGVVSPATFGANTSTTEIAYHGGQLNVTLDTHALSSHLRIDLADGGGVQGALQVERTSLPVPLGDGRTDLDGALTGQLQGDIRDLSLLPAFIPGIEHTQGRLSSTFSIAGSLDRPHVIGEMRLENGSTTIPSLGLNLEAIDVVARSDEQGRLRLDAELRSKDGNLRLGGDIRYSRAEGWDIQTRLNGERVEIVNTPEYHILASPDMRLTLKGHRIDLEGELLIPEAKLHPRDVSGAASPSADVVIVNTEGPITPEARWLIYSNVRVKLGDFVKFDGFGLKGLLNGDFILKDEPQKPTVARGELSIINGEYRAYGQKLSIERGRLLFFGGPVDNPGLDIRAVRKIEEVTAGILVRGTLKAPEVQLFSEPAMAETDALSYLLIGQPINKASSSEGQQLYGAALSLGLAGSGLLANQIGQRFGIDELMVESGGSFGTGALVIRHYLSPKLYISYGIGLTERFNIFLMRYQISRIWALEAESGTQTGADLVYTLEKK